MGNYLIKWKTNFRCIWHNKAGLKSPVDICSRAGYQFALEQDSHTLVAAKTATGQIYGRPNRTRIRVRDDSRDLTYRRTRAHTTYQTCRNQVRLNGKGNARHIQRRGNETVIVT